MHTINNPEQISLFDPLGALPASHLSALADSPEGIFRMALLKVMPVEKLAKKFSADMGAPSKELYAMAGLVLMKEFRNWTVAQTIDAYMWNTKVHLALNINDSFPTLSERSLYRYLAFFADDEEKLAQLAMERVTSALIEIGELDISEQRLDSTHIFSNMAIFGRTRLMGVAVKRFLTQVKRHDRSAYDLLDEDLRKRYEPSQGRLFADTTKEKSSEPYLRLRSQVAEDMYRLISIFEQHEKLSKATSFAALKRIFGEQCEVIDEKIEVRKKTGGRVMQNPSEPDGTYSGHKGPGFQAQFSETCATVNEFQIIASALPQTAADSDQTSVVPVLDDLEAADRLPKSLLTDCGYNSDANVEAAAERGVELVSPTKENSDLVSHENEIAESLTLDDFVFEEETERVVTCPAGHQPESSTYDETTQKTKTIMPAKTCASCDFSGECPIRRTNGQYQLEHTGKDRRLASRRREEMTDAFRERYAKRAGIESTNSGIKQVTGIGRLRVRGMPRVSMAIYLKVAGWNVLRAASSRKIREKVRMWLLERANAAERAANSIHAPSLALSEPMDRQVAWSQAA
jgi:hypothetical protein